MKTFMEVGVLKILVSFTYAENISNKHPFTMKMGIIIENEKYN